MRRIEHRPPAEGLPALEIQRSTRRRRSATAFVRDDRVVVQLPAGLDRPEEQRLIHDLVAKVTKRHRVERAGGDEALFERALGLSNEHLDGVRPRSVSWSDRMARRYGSCTVDDATIRISREVATFPEFVIDYILVHELAHLRIADHSPAFHALVERYPYTGEAKAWLDGYESGKARRVMGVDGIGGAPPLDLPDGVERDVEVPVTRAPMSLPPRRASAIDGYDPVDLLPPLPPDPTAAPPAPASAPPAPSPITGATARFEQPPLTEDVIALDDVGPEPELFGPSRHADQQRRDL